MYFLFYLAKVWVAIFKFQFKYYVSYYESN